MTTPSLRLLWPHESVRRRPDRYLPGEGPGAWSEALFRGLIQRMALPAHGNGAHQVHLRAWNGSILELSDDGFGLPSDAVIIQDAPISRLDQVMIAPLDPAELPSVEAFGPLANFGFVLNALCARVRIQTYRQGQSFEAGYSRGGIVAPIRASRHDFEPGTRIVAALDEALLGPVRLGEDVFQRIAEACTTDACRCLLVEFGPECRW